MINFSNKDVKSNARHKFLCIFIFEDLKVAKLYKKIYIPEHFGACLVREHDQHCDRSQSERGAGSDEEEVHNRRKTQEGFHEQGQA